jgi:hypothetical protein
MASPKPFDVYASAAERLRSELRDEAEMFHLAPVSLWLKDFSGASFSSCARW